MAVTYPLSFPTHKNPRGVLIRQRKVVGVNTSPGSLVTQTYEWPGERWEAELTFAPMNRADAETWMAWLTSLRGSVGSCLIGDPSGTAPRGTATGVATATGSILSRTITTTGSGTLKAGDWLQIGTGATSRLYKVLTDGTLGSGSIDIWPALRAAASGATLTYTSAKGVFMQSGTPEIQVMMGGIYQISPASFYEDLR
jgi:hypothetical protein